MDTMDNFEPILTTKFRAIDNKLCLLWKKYNGYYRSLVTIFTHNRSIVPLAKFQHAYPKYNSL